MKNKALKRKKTNNKIFILAILIILLSIMFFILFKQKSSNNIEKQIGEVHISNYSIEVGSNNTIINFDKAIAKTREEINAPQMGAGMIPIIDIGGGLFEITTIDDTKWYDYTKNKPAYMMLSDGKYLSELQQDMTNKELAENGIQFKSEELGTVYVWIPRFAYCENNIGFLKNAGVINAMNWVTPDLFTVQTKNSSFNTELTGIWIEKGIQTSSTNTETKATQMNNIDNTYGIIANEKVFKLNEYTKQILDIFNTYYNLETFVTDYNNINRTYIKVIDTNKQPELIAKAYMYENEVSIKILKNDYEIDKVIHEITGVEIENFKYDIQRKGGFYPFIVIDKKGNVVSCSAGYEENPPDLKGFRVDTTYVVTYSGEINNGTATETSGQPISEILAEGYTVDENNALVEGEIDFSKVNESRGKWYQYNEQKWANIVVRNNGNEAYFVWIPRYAYAINSESQTTDILFVDTDNINLRTEKAVDLTKYTIPEAFTWTDDNGNTIQLSGYWMGKYQVSSFSTFGLTAQVYNGVNKIRLTNIRNNVVSTSNAKYEVTLLKDGEVIKKIDNADTTLTEFSETTGTKLTGGNYEILIVLYDERNYYRGEVTLKTEVYNHIEEETEPNAPELDGFNEHTYYVVYNEDGTEDSSIPITETPPENWYNYLEQKWANIVVRNNGNEAYFVWIPRYEYYAYGGEEKTDVYFIPKEQETATYGYTIPEAFTWTDDNGNTIQLSGYWMGKYQVSSFSTFGLTAQVYNGVNKIRLTNIRNNVVSTSNARYEVTLLKDGEVIKKIDNADTTLTEFSEATGTKLAGGIYEILMVLYDEKNYYRGEVTLKTEVYNHIEEETEPNAPELDGFNPEITYYVTYDTDGNETLTPITSSPPENWYNYSEQKWANIVVKNEEVGKTAYFVWIPRYEYYAYGGEETTDVYFIPKEQETATYGYTIPEAFTWLDDEENTIQLSGYWMGKYQVSN